MSRPGWDEYFLGIAAAVAARGDCTRRKVGAIVVRDNRIISTGYNGSPPGGPSCLAGECPRGKLSYSEQPADVGYDNCVAVHAEGNALLYAGRDGCLGSTLYLTDLPCPQCWKLIRASGIALAVWPAGNGTP